MIIHYDIIQGTPEWHELRKGKLTASHGTAIGNYGKALETYCREIVQNMIHEKENYNNCIIHSCIFINNIYSQRDSVFL